MRMRRRPGVQGNLFRGLGSAVRLESFLAPVGAREFFSKNWEQSPRVVSRRSRDYHAGLISIADLDAALSQLRAPGLERLLRVVKQDGKRLLSRTVPTTSRSGVDLRALRESSAEGYTLVLNDLDRRWSPISVLARSLEERLGHRVGVNAYFTPSRSQGFLPHSDDHDVFILQIEGEKAWRVYKPLIELPTGPVPQDSIRRSLRVPVMTCTLSPGDALYLPRGWIHECATSRRASLHLTVGVHVRRWLDFVKAALDQAADKSVSLRKAIPSAMLGEVRDDRAADAAWRGILETLSTVVAAPEAMSALEAHFIDGVEPPLDGSFARAGRESGLGLESRVTRRPGMSCQVTMKDGVSSIRFPGNSVSGPFLIDPALRYISGARRFRVKDLPDSLDAKAKIVLVRRLVREGLLKADKSR